MELPMNTYFSVRCLLCCFGPGDAFRNLRIYQKFTVSLFSGKGTNSSYGLIEPLSYTVKTVMYPASILCLMFPGGGGSLFEHIQISGICFLLQHGVDKIGLIRLCCPFHHDRYADKSGIEVPVKLFYCPLYQCFCKSSLKTVLSYHNFQEH